MNTLTPEDNDRNHWFKDYWEDIFDCDIDHKTGELISKSTPKYYSFCSMLRFQF